MRLSFSRLALDDIAFIHDYMVGEWGEDQVVKYVGVAVPESAGYHAAMPAETIETRAHTLADGRLELSLHTHAVDAEVAVTVVIRELAQSAGIDRNGWPDGFFDEVSGSMPELRRWPQGEFEERELLG